MMTSRKEVSFDVNLESAKKCYGNKTRWHFHILTPACMFNDKEEFAIIFANETAKEQLKQGEKPEELFYGRA
jgi:hypothetical protein